MGRIILLIIVLVIGMGGEIYAPKINYINSEEYINFIDKSSRENIEKTSKFENVNLDIGEREVIFVNNTLSDEIIETIRGVSYKENNEIHLEDLAHIQVTYWGFDDREHTGELIVNTLVAEDIIEIFKELHKAKFPIEKINLIDQYNANDDLSMIDNNTSAFCYREIGGSKGQLSNHSYGIAIDINPIQNPYIKDNIILPEEGKKYLDRDNVRKGMIVEGDACYNAFKNRGWTWGGEWRSLKDYQHFEFRIPGGE